MFFGGDMAEAFQAKQKADSDKELGKGIKLYTEFLAAEKPEAGDLDDAKDWFEDRSKAIEAIDAEFESIQLGDDADKTALCQIGSRCRGRGYHECRKLLQDTCSRASAFRVSTPDMCSKCESVNLGRIDAKVCVCVHGCGRVWAT